MKNDLFAFSLAQRLKQPSLWDKINALLDWDPLVQRVETSLKAQRKSPAGRKGFDTVKHIKALLLRAMVQPERSGPGKGAEDSPGF